MLGINGAEFFILAIIAVMVIGPERLPEYASQLARLVKELRRMATGAREHLREEVGPEFDDVDWRKLDPRQYDPRRIIKEALLDDIEDAIKPVSDDGPAAVSDYPPVNPDNGTGVDAVATVPRLAEGERPPFDAEAT